METSGNPADYRRAVEKALEDGLGTTTNPIATDQSTYTKAAFPYAYVALQELRYGTTHFEEDRIVLRRRETIAGQIGAAPQMKIGISQLIYTTQQLQVPTSVPFTLPDLAVLEDRPESVWGWRFQGRDVEYDGVTTDRIHEFALYAWSTNLYTPAGSNFVYSE